MKREIVCLGCEWAHPLEKFPGEWIVTITGEVCGEDLRCDLCNKSLPVGTRAVARSSGTARQKYFPWEWDYISHTGADETLNLT